MVAIHWVNNVGVCVGMMMITVMMMVVMMMMMHVPHATNRTHKYTLLPYLPNYQSKAQPSPLWETWAWP